ncbi:hypothetical protein T10_3413 [Trichinella papuae]|uniref:Uncharacterized protein n=1 Tax=Trichinella papuae TaxID=268474 RepID=A0A0V1N7S6_9BILA|nr:hypothetical protein T10_3413 [Trichinella papuae]
MEEAGHVHETPELTLGRAGSAVPRISRCNLTKRETASRERNATVKTLMRLNRTEHPGQQSDQIRMRQDADQKM